MYRPRCGHCDHCKIVENLKHQYLYDLTENEIIFRLTGRKPTTAVLDEQVRQWNLVLSENPCDAWALLTATPEHSETDPVLLDDSVTEV
jgi:hypothetical protein